MNGAASSPWRVELTRSAADQLRALGPVVRRSLVPTLDAMVDGPPAGIDRDDPDTVQILSTPTGHVVRCLVRGGDRIVLVLAVEAAERPAGAPTGGFGLVERIRVLSDELRFAARSLRRAPAFTLGVVLTVGFGLGGATTIFGLVDTVFRGALPFEDAERLVRIRSLNVRSGGEEFAFNVTPRDYHLLRDGSRAFDGVIGQAYGSLSLLGDGPAVRAAAIGVGPGWAEVLGIEPILGRTFTADEHALGEGAGVVVLSHALWQTRFGADERVIGRSLSHQSGVVEVVGVLGPGFAYPYDADLWQPRRFDAADWTSSDLNVVARLAPGIDLEEARADAGRLYATLQAESPGVTPNVGFRTVPLRDNLIDDEVASLQSLAVAVVFLLALVCVNVAGLLTARLVARSRETVLRAALGAGRGRLLQGALAESVLLFSAGGALAVGLTMLFGDAVSVLVPSTLREQLDVASVGDGPAVVGFAAVVAILAGGLTGLVAAWRASRVDLQSVLRAGARGGAASGRLRDALVVTELALSLGLLVAAGVLAEHFRTLQRADLGFETEGLYTTQMAVQNERYASEPSRLSLTEGLRTELLATPGVEGLGFTSVNPLCCGDWGANVRAEGTERREGDPPVVVHHRYVTPDYFGTLGIPLLRGRNFGPSDRTGTAPVVIVDADLARRLWPGEDPIGRRVGLDRDGEPLRTVVGVAAPAYASGDDRPTWYLPFEQEPLGRSNDILHLMVRASSSDVLDEVRGATARVDATLALFGTATMESLREENIAQDRLGAIVVTLFAVAGLFLAGLGVYGLLAYRVELRRRELGTRMALGARRAAVAAMVLGGSMRLFAIGLALGGALAYGLNQALARVVDGVEMADVGMLATLALVLGVVVILSTAVPAARAVGVDPARVLGSE